MTRTQRMRRQVEMQGFTGLSDQDLWDLNYWLRLSPFLCAVWAGAGTLLGSPALLWALAPFAAAGALLRGHPFDAIYDHVVRHLLGSPRIPRYGRPRRFACGLATLWLLGTGWAFHAGLPALGRVLGFFMVGVQAVQVTTGLCLPSLTYQRLTRRTGARSAPEET
jgi:hypothetical protein